MTGRRIRARAGGSSRGTQKVAAIAAAGVILLSGAAVTSMAAWSDTEWVQGGVGTLPGISTSTFHVQQNTTLTSDASDWVDEPDSPGGVVAFVDASGLTPGDTAYGFVRLRTTADSIAGTVSMFAGPHAAGDDLYEGLRYGAGLVASGSDCNAVDFGTGDDDLVAFDTAMGEALTTDFAIAASAASERVVCYAVTLPPSAPSSLQGLSTTPEWYFVAESD